jgi:hypothetical protein
MLFIAYYYSSSDLMVIDDAVFGVKQCQREEKGEDDIITESQKAKREDSFRSFGILWIPSPLFLLSLTFLIFNLRHASRHVTTYATTLQLNVSRSYKNNNQ